MSADAVVVGSGLNGLAAAVTPARAGLAVEVAGAVGEGLRATSLFRPDVVHDRACHVGPPGQPGVFTQEIRTGRAA